MSAPALSWDAIANMTKVEIELTSDAVMYLFFEKAMRANNRFSISHNPKQESKHIVHLDANNF